MIAAGRQKERAWISPRLCRGRDRRRTAGVGEVAHVQVHVPDHRGGAPVHGSPPAAAMRLLVLSGFVAIASCRSACRHVCAAGRRRPRCRVRPGRGGIALRSRDDRTCRRAFQAPRDGRRIVRATRDRAGGSRSDTAQDVRRAKPAARRASRGARSPRVLAERAECRRSTRSRHDAETEDGFVVRDRTIEVGDLQAHAAESRPRQTIAGRTMPYGRMSSAASIMVSSTGTRAWSPTASGACSRIGKCAAPRIA